MTNTDGLLIGLVLPACLPPSSDARVGMIQATANGVGREALSCARPNLPGSRFAPVRRMIRPACPMVWYRRGWLGFTNGLGFRA